jgi:ABC-2 type transport system permease protein
VSTVKLALRQVKYTNHAFWRNPASAFFTFAFPLMFLVIFTGILGSGTTDFAVDVAGTSYTFALDQASYYVVAMASFGVLTATYTNVAISVSFNRDAGILKRTRGTPLPPSAYLAGRVVHAMIISAILVVITTVFGVVFYGADVPTGTHLLEFIAMLLVGGLSFCALGLAVTAIIPNADASPEIVNATILPLNFLSGIFFPVGANAPAWITTISTIFPVKHFIDGMLGGFLGSTTFTGPGGVEVPAFPFHWLDVAIVAAWGIGGLVAAVRFFSWEPRR